MLQKKKHLKNSSVNLILLFKYSRYFYYSDIYECPLAEMISFDLSEKCCLKLAIFTSPIFQVINYFKFNWFRLHIWQQKRIWLIAFLTNLWCSSMFSYDADMTVVNYINRDVENVFVLGSDLRIFLSNLSFRVYLYL